MMKRVFLTVFCILLTVMALPLTAGVIAESDGMYTYHVMSRDQTVVIQSYDGPGGHVTVPDTLGGYPVSEIGMSAFEDRDDLLSLTLPDGLTEFSPYACTGCDQLQAFRVSENSARFSVRDGILYNKEGTVLIQCPSTQKKTIAVPKGVTVIGEAAFSACKGITAVTLPKTVKRIEGMAFSQCTSLASINFPDGLEIIGYLAFSNCRQLRSITIPDSVRMMAVQAFTRCTSLKTVHLGAGVTVLEEAVFSNCTALTSIVIPDGVEKIFVEAFSGCTALKEITVGKGVKRISEYAFEGCTSLKTVHLPKNIEVIEHHAFDGCNGITDVYYDQPSKFSHLEAYNDGLENATWHLRENKVTTRPITPVGPTRDASSTTPTTVPTAEPTEPPTGSVTEPADRTSASVTEPTAEPNADPSEPAVSAPVDGERKGPDLWVVLMMVAALVNAAVLAVTLLRQKRGEK